MVVMDQSAGRLPPEFWSRPAIAAALASCDFATLLEEVRRVHGWTQTELARVVGYSQSWVSKVVRRNQILTVDQVREISRSLGLPIHLVRFSDPGGDDPTKRRDFGMALMLAALAPMPRRAEVDETTAQTLTAITGGQRRLDATMPARELVRGATAHVEMANRIYARAQRFPFAPALAAAISEAAGFAGWLHTDMYDIGTARSYYRLAVDRAHRAGNRLLAGYMLGSLAAFEIDADDPSVGLALIAQARQQIDQAAHPTPRAWLATIEAVGHAAAGRGNAAAHALRTAEGAIELGDTSIPPPWPWVFPFDHAKLAGYRALVAVRLDRPADALAAFAESLAAVQPAPKQRAIVMLEVATAARQDGTRRRDTARTDEAFGLACEALTIGLTYSSERVVQHARRFRHAYTGPGTGRVREFDHQLRSTLP
jgi:transcriptional regulator with XRE-family HTH domain